MYIVRERDKTADSERDKTAHFSNETKQPIFKTGQNRRLIGKNKNRRICQCVRLAVNKISIIM